MHNSLNYTVLANYSPIKKRVTEITDSSIVGDMEKLSNLGINIVLKHPDINSIDIYINTLKKLRVGWVRLEFNFYEREPEELMVYLVESLQESNIKILGLLTGLIPGNFITTFMPSRYFRAPIEILEEYLKYIDYTVKKYSSFINHWEIWNEENTVRFWVHSPNPAEYMELLYPSVQHIKSIQPEAKIVMGAIMGDDVTPFAPFQYMGFLKKCIELGIDKYVDIYNFHPYIPQCYMSLAKEEVYMPKIKKAIHNFLDLYEPTKKPLWITEFGICPKWVKIPQESIAKIYYELYTYLDSKNIPLFFWVLTDFPKNQFYSGWNPELYFGFLDKNLHKKPLLAAFLDCF